MSSSLVILKADGPMQLDFPEEYKSWQQLRHSHGGMYQQACDAMDKMIKTGNQIVSMKNAEIDDLKKLNEATCLEVRKKDEKMQEVITKLQVEMVSKDASIKQEQMRAELRAERLRSESGGECANLKMQLEMKDMEQKFMRMQQGMQVQLEKEKLKSQADQETYDLKLQLRDLQMQLNQAKERNRKLSAKLAQLTRGHFVEDADVSETDVEDLAPESSASNRLPTRNPRRHGSHRFEPY